MDPRQRWKDGFVETIQKGIGWIDRVLGGPGRLIEDLLLWPKSWASRSVPTGFVVGKIGGTSW